MADICDIHLIIYVLIYEIIITNSLVLGGLSLRGRWYSIANYSFIPLKVRDLSSSKMERVLAQDFYSQVSMGQTLTRYSVFVHLKCRIYRVYLLALMVGIVDCNGRSLKNYIILHLILLYPM